MSDPAKVKARPESKSPLAGSSSSSKTKKSSKKEKKKSKAYSLNSDDIRYLTANTRYDEKEIK
jgi:hypothetical protein